MTEEIEPIDAAPVSSVLKETSELLTKLTTLGTPEQQARARELIVLYFTGQLTPKLFWDSLEDECPAIAPDNDVNKHLLAAKTNSRLFQEILDNLDLK